MKRLICALLALAVFLGLLPEAGSPARAAEAASARSIDFTKPADWDKFEIVGQTQSEPAEGVGLTLIATRSAIEPCTGQLSGDEANTPEDLVDVPVFGDWTATLKLYFDPASARNGYYQYFGFFAAQGSDYQKIAGIRGGDGSIHDLFRMGDKFTYETNALLSDPGFSAPGDFWFRISKSGDTYTCARSWNGTEFNDMFAFEDTGLEADRLVIDAYSGMTEGYTFTLKSLQFEDDGRQETYTVSYHANGGTGAPAAQTKTRGTALTLSAAKPSKSYTVTYHANGGSVSSASKTVACTFSGWNTAAGGSGTAYAPGASYTVDESATLYAQWTDPAAGSLLTPTREGYAFDGWYTAAVGGDEVTSTTKISKDTAIYAHWTAQSVPVTYTVRYEANGGTGAPASQTKTQGVPLTLTTEKPTRVSTITFNANGGSVSPASKDVNWTFTGWADATLGGLTYDAGAVFTKDADTTLYAQWATPTAGSLPTPTRENDTFDGWYTETNGGSKFTSTAKIGSNLTVYAHWTPKSVPATYTVSYDANGGTGAPAAQTKTEGTALTLRTAKPSKSVTLRYDANGGSVSPASKTLSCTFSGWNTAAGGSGTAYAPGASYTVDESATLYAQWTDPAAGSLPTPTREDDIFDGWYTAADGGSKVTAATAIAKDTVIYAHWSAAQPEPLSWDENQSGICGKNLRWSYEAQTGTLSIVGSGDMYDYDDQNNPVPWSDGADRITALSLPVGMTGISDYAFSGCGNLTEAAIPESVKRIGDYAFEDCAGLKHITVGEGGTEHDPASRKAAKSAFNDVPAKAFYAEPVAWAVEQGVTTGTSATTFSPDMSCTRAQMVTFLWRSMVKPAQKQGDTGIGAGAFRRCTSLESVILGWNVSSVGKDAFLGCSRLKSMHIYGEVCSVFDSEETLGKPGKTTVYAYLISGLSDYADKYGYSFVSLGTRRPADSSCEGGSSCPGHVFRDMPPVGRWDHDAVDWAVQTGITTGTSPTTFSPEATCTRAQVVTFLWRSAGNPEPIGTGASFTDLKPGAYYEKAVAWAVEQSITNGVSENKFAPDTVCTRGQIVTFLYRKCRQDTCEHTYRAEVTKPTCTEKGYTTYTCSRCGARYRDNVTDSLGHDYRAGAAVRPTCTAQGYTPYVCSRCGDSYRTEYTSALGHDYRAGTVTKPTCTERGYTTYYCSRCGDSYPSDYTSALGHDYRAGAVTKPTCTEKGYTTYTCSRCGARIQDDETSALGHDYRADSVVKPTCTEGGYTVYVCSRCGASYKGNQTSALGHRYENGACVRCGAASRYRTYINILQNTPSNGQYGTAFTYDVDGNGVEELFIVYPDGNGALHGAVYTLNGSKAVEIMDVYLGVLAGGGGPYVGVYRMNGKNMICLGFETTSPWYRTGKWYFYSLSGASFKKELEVKADVDMEEFSDVVISGYATFNGSSKPGSEYITWRNNLSPVAYTRGYYSSDPKEYGFKFDDMIRILGQK